ncbi:chromate transporter [Mycobacterium avium]|uniref:chromate transporter n=1 Tax=Mycobacterium avium TaxID=1764 RepID=UPI0015CA9680|nr:chromate transporter [Mycobacterium avium]
MSEADPQPPADQRRGSAAAESAGAVGFGRILAYFLKLGAIGFGGPIAIVGYMQRDLVERRQWIDRRDFLDGVALGHTMPGPLAAQVAMWVGYLRRGSLGAAAVAATFVAPSFAIVVAVGAVYSRYSGSSFVQTLFYGIAPAVMAIITIAAIKLVKLTDRRDWRLWGISAAVFALTALTGSEPVLVIVGAGLLMTLLDARPQIRFRRRKPPSTATSSSDAATSPQLGPASVDMAITAKGGRCHRNARRRSNARDRVQAPARRRRQRGLGRD